MPWNKISSIRKCKFSHVHQLCCEIVAIDFHRIRGCWRILEIDPKLDALQLDTSGVKQVYAVSAFWSSLKYGLLVEMFTENAMEQLWKVTGIYIKYDMVVLLSWLVIEVQHPAGIVINLILRTRFGGAATKQTTNATTLCEGWPEVERHFKHV